MPSVDRFPRLVEVLVSGASRGASGGGWKGGDDTDTVTTELILSHYY